MGLKGLVVGGGSIGIRHLKNLKILGLTDLAVVEPNSDRLTTICSDLAVTGFATLDEGIAWQPTFAVVASPSNLHVQHAIQLARHNSHLFIEKPLSHTNEGLEILAQEVRQRNLISLVGCNMRFHPGPAQVKLLLDENAIGQILSAQVYTGSYLPEWRPHQNYKQSYSANAEMGGGCILDCIHEIDLARWYLDDVEAVFGLAKNSGTLGIEVEDIATLICQHKSQAVSEIHLDYVQRTYQRGCRIVGETGSIFWEFTEGTVRLFKAEENAWETFAQPDSWQVNQMYVDEIAHFLECVQQQTQTCLPISEAIELMKIVFAAKNSNDTGCFIYLD